MNQIEDRLARKHAEYQAAPIPAQVELSVLAGVRQAVRHRKIRLRAVTAAAAACALILFFGGIRVSPVFASYVKQIPGMEGIVELISQDKGLQLAAEHDLIQPVNLTNTHGGNSLTVNGVIVDESRIVIFYRLAGEAGLETKMNDLKLLDEYGQRIPASFGYYAYTGDSNKLRMIDINMQEGISPPNQITVSFQSSIKPSLGELRVTLPLDATKTAGMNKEILLNQELVVDGQRIHLKRMTLSPTRLTLEISFSENNSKRIFGLRDLKLVDEQGREWVTRAASITSDNSQSIYFESMYFSSPMQLTLKGSGITALDKDQLDVIVDLDHNQLLKGPKGLSFTRNQISSADRVIGFQLDRSDIYPTNMLFDHITDSKGIEYAIGGSQSGTIGDTKAHIEESFTIKDGAQASGKLHMRISSFPVQSADPFELKLPLPAESRQ